jgi:DNA-binding MarR family transcriptional regulator
MKTNIKVDLTILQNGDLNFQELMILSLIMANLDDGFCTSTNAEFESVLDMSDSSITRYIKNLDRKDYIERFIDQENIHGAKRIINLTPKTKMYK